MKSINNNENTASLFIEEGDKKVWAKFKKDMPKDAFKPWQVTKKVVKLSFHFIFDGLKVHRILSKLKILGNINFFKNPIDRLYNIVFHRKTKLSDQEKTLVKKSIETMDQELRIATIKKAQGLVLFLVLALISVLLVPILFFQIDSISMIVYINIGLSCFLLFLLIVGRLKDAYVLKHAAFNKKDIFHRRFWNLSTQLSTVAINQE